MKKVLLIFTLFFITLGAHAQNKNAKAMIEVDGICLMCKNRIEKAAIKTKGVKSAVWDINTHMLSVIYDENKTNLNTIHQSVADAGHDTKKVTASAEAYASIHGCCKYRDQAVVEEH